MKASLDPIDGQLLDVIQREFPVCEEPFAELGQKLGLAEPEVIGRIARLKSDRVVRQISAIFDSTALGYSGALVAFKVRHHALDGVAAAVAAHTGVSHCYARDAAYNLWFTLTVGPERYLDGEIMLLDRLDGVEASMVLPAIKVFKIGVFLRMGEEPSSTEVAYGGRRRVPAALSDGDRAAVRALQRDLPLVHRPFDETARLEELTEHDLLARAHRFLAEGTMRRFAAVLHHTQAGYRANAMVCWCVPAGAVSEVGPVLAANPAVSHCYERPAFPDWPYSLYTMIHARTDDELEHIIGALAQASGLSDYSVLRTVKEYKKSRVLYFRESAG